LVNLIYIPDKQSLLLNLVLIKGLRDLLIYLLN